jgi:hypothetical protein
VDRDIQKTGYLPHGVGNENGEQNNRPSNDKGRTEGWACSAKQKDLITKIVEENRLDKNQVEALAQDRFGKSVRALNKLQASGLIDELLSQTGGNANGNQRRRFGGRTNQAGTR